MIKMTEKLEMIECPMKIDGCIGLPQAIGNYEVVDLFNWGEMLEKVDGQSVNISCPTFLECYAELAIKNAKYRRPSEIKV